MTNTTQYLKQLDAELASAGIRGGRRRRIIAEFADHLGSDPNADLGEPGALAAQFADELGTSFARTAALQAFLALALAGLLVSARLVALLRVGVTDFGTGDTVALLIAAAAGQVALVAGGLGLQRALRLHGRQAISKQEATVLARRAGLALIAGAVTILSLPMAGSSRANPGTPATNGLTMNSWWTVASVVGLVALLAAVPALVRASRLRPQDSGPAGDLLADLGPLRPVAERISRGSVDRLALLLAAGLAIVVALAGVAADDPFDGILRALMESGAFLGGYALLGRYLGIKP